MGSSKKKLNLDKTIASLQERWGNKAVRPLKEIGREAFPHIPTGFSALDEALGIGGLPRGRISEIIGTPTSGMVTLALRVLAKAQEKAEVGVYVDSTLTFDPDYASRCGLILNRLILVRPEDLHQGLAIMQDFVLGGGLSVLVFDTPLTSSNERQTAQAVARTLDRLIAPLSKTECALLMLTALPIGQPSLASYSHQTTLPHYASVRLFVERERWLYRQHDIQGYQAQITIVKNKLGPVNRPVSISLTFAGEP